jgi:hypothetical protein
MALGHGFRERRRSDCFLTGDYFAKGDAGMSMSMRMRMTSFRKTHRGSRESGQSMLVFLLALGLFLIGAIGFSVDMSHAWLHRQTAQNVADSVCTAGVMDMLATANGATLSPGFTSGTAFQCSGATTSAPCRYGALNNGSNASSLTAGVPGYDVNVSFPSTVAGVPACSSATPPAVCRVPGVVNAHPYMQVNVTDRVQTFFAGMIRGSSTMDVGAQASCGLVLSQSPIPILVLNPTVSGSVSGNGNIDIRIVGGPQRSIQVNSSSATAVSISGASGDIDLTLGGPDSPADGSDFAVVGNEGPAGIFATGSNGRWIPQASVIADPLALLAVPAQPGAPSVPADVAAITSCNTSAKIAAGGCTVPISVHGCPDTTCILYTGGFYSAGISAPNNKVAIFDPGLYYLNNGLSLGPNSCVRPSTSAGDGSGGTMFYFADTHSVTVSSNTGDKCPATTVPLSQVKCTTSSLLPTNLPSGGLSGNVLFGPCTGTYGDPLGTSDPIGEQHGIVFFQNRSASGVSAQWGGGAAFGLIGTMYFHYCNSADGPGLGTNCNSTAFNDSLALQGGSSAASFVVGETITDKLDLGGNPSMTMDLNPNALYYVLKAALIQ